MASTLAGGGGCVVAPCQETAPVEKRAGKLRCCRCKQITTSYFDHHCPKCDAIVCISCLDDFRLILSNFRCPHCGDEASNQQALQREIWFINAYRSTERVLGALGQAAISVFTEPMAAPALPAKGSAGVP